MIVAILPDPSSVEILLNNLSEADFEIDKISVIMQDLVQRDRVAHDAGLLKGTTAETIVNALVKIGIGKKNAEACQGELKKGKAVVVMDVPAEYQNSAEEMFKDHSAQLIKG